MPHRGRLTAAGLLYPLGVTWSSGAQPAPAAAAAFPAGSWRPGRVPLSPARGPRRYLRAEARAGAAKAGRSPRPAPRPPLNGGNGEAPPPPRPFPSRAHRPGSVLVWFVVFGFFFPPFPCQLTPSSAEPAAFDLRAAGSGEERGRFSSPPSRPHRTSPHRTPALPSGGAAEEGPPPLPPL